MLNILLYSAGGEELTLPAVPESMSGADLMSTVTDFYPPPDAFVGVVRLLIGGQQIQTETSLQLIYSAIHIMTSRTLSIYSDSDLVHAAQASGVHAARTRATGMFSLNATHTRTFNAGFVT